MKICLLAIAGVVIFVFPAAAAGKTVGDYGVNIHVMWEHKEVPEEFRMLADANIHFIRSDFSWVNQEKAPGQWDFTRHDAAAAEAARRGLTLLPIIGYAPRWGKPAHEKLNQWLASVEKNLERYGKTMPYWEIWNEHNYRIFWENPNPSDYLKLLKPTAELIRRKCPQAKIVLGGTSQIPMSYIETLFKEGAGSCFDVMNIHPYCWYDIPEVELQKQLEDLQALMKQYNLGDKELWITEIGWPTYAEKTFMQEFLPGALQTAGIKSDGMRMAILDDNKMPLVASSPGLDFARFFPKAEEIRQITLAELAELNPREYPVLIAASGESFSPDAKDVDALVSYVKNGGLAVFPRGIPFYTALQKNQAGIWERGRIDKNFRSRLRFDFDAWWLDRTRPMPHNFTGKVPDSLRDRISLSKPVSTHAILKPVGFKGNDRMITLIEGSNENTSGPLAAYFKFDSDFKGGVIATTLNWVGAAPIGEQLQAELLPRTILVALSSGVQKIFWYEFQAMENKPEDSEHYFGLTHRDLTPKPAWHAYETLVKYRPSGSSKPQSSETGGVRIFRWPKPDGPPVHALYVTGTPLPVSIEWTGSFCSAYNYLGKPVDLKPGNGTANLTLSGKILYLIGPQTIKVLNK